MLRGGVRRIEMTMATMVGNALAGGTSAARFSPTGAGHLVAIQMPNARVRSLAITVLA